MIHKLKSISTKYLFKYEIPSSATKHMGLIGMVLVLYNIGNENKENDHDDGYIVGSSMHRDINPRKFKRNEVGIGYIECVCESSLSLETLPFHQYMHI